MAVFTKIGKIEFNMHKFRVGDVQDSATESYTLGCLDVVDIQEGELIDKSFYRVFFSNGSFQDIFNISQVYWIEDI